MDEVEAFRPQSQQVILKPRAGHAVPADAHHAHVVVQVQTLST
jgi:hypothetical protein